MLQRKLYLIQHQRLCKRFFSTPILPQQPTPTNTNSSTSPIEQHQQAQQIIKDYGINSAKFAAFGLKKRYDEDADQFRTVPVTPEVIKLGYTMAWKALLWATIINLFAAAVAVYYIIFVWECKSIQDVRIKLKQVINNMGLETLSDREEYNEKEMEALEKQDPTRKEKVDKVKHFFKSVHIFEEEDKK